MTHMDSQTNVGQKAQDVASQAREKSSEVVQQAQDTAKSTLHQQKGRAAESVSVVADALRQTSTHLQDQDQQAFGNVANQVADRLDRFSNDLQNKSVDEMFDDVQRFARRDPQLFLGGAVVLGLLAARFLKSSGQRSQQRQMGSWNNEYDYNRGSRLRSYPRQGLTDYRSGTFQGEYSESYPTGDYSSTETGSTTGTTFSMGDERASSFETGRPSTDFAASQPRTRKPGSDPDAQSDQGTSWRTNE